MKTYTVLPDQSLFDIAVLTYGDLSGIAWLLADNPGLNGPTDRLYVGQVLRLRSDVINLRTKVYLDDFPPIATIKDIDRPVGVGFWRLDEYMIG